MKKVFSLLVLSCLVLASHAQSVYICKDGDYIKKDISEGLTIDLEEVPDSITFNKPALPIVVEIVYKDTEASVTIPHSVRDSVTCTRVNGLNSYVYIEYKGKSDEIIYNVTGHSTNGSLVIKSDYKMQVNLNNVTLNSTCGEAMRFKCNKRVALVMAEGSVNTFTDSNDNGVTPDPLDGHKACIYTKGHIELSGAGTLNVTGNYNHAIATKEYIKVKKTVKAINILGAVNDAIHAGQYFQMNGGTINIDGNTIGDGIQVEFKTDDLGAFVEDEENTGEVVITNGTINVTMAANPNPDPDATDPYQDTKCIKADGNVTITGGTLVLNATANGSRGIQADGTLTIDQAEDVTTNITIYAEGGKCTLKTDKDDPDKCMGINVNRDITISGGTIKITASGTSANGMKADRDITIEGGDITIEATGDRSNGMKIGNNVTVTGGNTLVINPETAFLSKGIVYSGKKNVIEGTVTASWFKKTN